MGLGQHGYALGLREGKGPSSLSILQIAQEQKVYFLIEEKEGVGIEYADKSVSSTRVNVHPYCSRDP